MPETTRTVFLRMISRPEERETILSRLDELCQTHKMTCTVTQDEIYWKIPDRTETTVELFNCPTLNYGKWSQFYHGLFGCEFVIRWEPDEAICLYTDPSVPKESLWAYLHIPSPCFWPKPSKDIRH